MRFRSHVLANPAHLSIFSRSLRLGACLLALGLGSAAHAQIDEIEKRDQPDVFRQLEEELPTPNVYRNASGAPGVDYWQQRADHEISVEIDDVTQVLTGTERIVYTNNSPDTLSFLWVHLDNNNLGNRADSVLVGTAPDMDSMSYRDLNRLLARRTFDGSVQLDAVTDDGGNTLPHIVSGTLLRIDLPEPLASGDQVAFRIGWHYQMNRSDEVGARTAAEYFEDDGNWIYEVAHWFPRMCVYSDVEGWHNKQFLGRGEFTLEFGDYTVAITMPDDHVVAATGVLQNPEDVLPAKWQERLDQAMSSEEPMFVVTPDEAEANEGTAPGGKKTWVYKAENVRDFAWASSRKFIWDAWGVPVEDRTVLCMSYYPNEGEPLWSRYSTQAIAHTLDVYGKFSIPYPYPVAISVNGPVGGMEYPMICFNGPRPEEDGTYSARTKYGLISVIIHEVGHNWFPMIINSDERQWTWMDEGLNTFVQYLAEQEWEPEYPSRRGEARNITGYMASANQVPIMTNSESILQFGANAYAKPATALNVLRETVMGRELFDFAFKTYSERWAFKRPMPADLFRTMEDASAVDLDWFFRGWFYTTDHVDVALTDVVEYVLDNGEPVASKGVRREERDSRPVTPSMERNVDLAKRSDRFPDLLDFYNEYDELDVTPADRRRYQELLDGLEANERALLDTDLFFYVLRFENQGGLVTPLPLRLFHEDGSFTDLHLPAEIWKNNSEQVAKLVPSERRVVRVQLDPKEETADIDTWDNSFPQEIRPTRFELFKRGRDKNPMQKAAEEAEREAEDASAQTAGDSAGGAAGDE
ncbi:MAG: M1 family metallopeptidase [Planctomycetota bacterium]|jgi:hypothetical protein